MRYLAYRLYISQYCTHGTISDFFKLLFYYHHKGYTLAVAKLLCCSSSLLETISLVQMKTLKLKRLYDHFRKYFLDSHNALSISMFSNFYLQVLLLNSRFFYPT